MTDNPFGNPDVPDTVPQTGAELLQALKRAQTKDVALLAVQEAVKRTEHISDEDWHQILR